MTSAWAGREQRRQDTKSSPPPPPLPTRFPFRCSYVFHYQVADGITYMCLADDKAKRSIPFQFLADVKDRFTAAYRDRARTAIAFAMNAEFSRVLSERMVSGRCLCWDRSSFPPLPLGPFASPPRKLATLRRRTGTTTRPRTALAACRSSWMR